MIKWCNSIEYRQVIGLDKLITFGLETEFVQARRICVTENLKCLMMVK